MTKKRLLIAEDSVFVQRILAKIFEQDPEIEVVGVAKNGKMAVDMARKLRPDVITMDIRMPVMDGFQATRIIMSQNPTPILVLSSSIHDEDLKISFNAIQAGALDIMEKPRGNLSGNYLEIGTSLVKKVKLISEIKVFRHLSPRHLPPIEPHMPKTLAKAVAVGASTGGPSALFSILTSFDDDFPAPIFVTLHISEGFGKGCVEWIRRNSRLEVREAGESVHIEPGTVYFAPDDRLMRVVSKSLVTLDEGRISRGVCPINEMMRSFAKSYGMGGLGVLLTGMGDDGVLGLRAIKEMGGRTIAQDRESCVVYGMPKEAVRLGVVDREVALEKIPETILDLLRD